MGGKSTGTMTHSSHTFLLEEGLWLTSGYYLDRRRKAAVQGNLLVTHTAEAWVSQSQVMLLTEPLLQYTTHCRITPFEKGGFSTEWRANHSLFGLLTGTFTIVGDSILSSYASPNGSYTGTEYLLRVFDTEYISRGVIFKRRQRLVSWIMELVRQDEG